MKKLFYSYIILMVCAVAVYAQVPAPAPAQSEPIALMNGTAHLGNGEVIENSIITFREGKIETVAPAANVRVDLTEYRQIDAEGKHIYPGLINAMTNLGLEEIAAVRATLDYSETGSFKPHVRTAIAYNTDSELIPTMKFTGIQIAQIAPRGGRIEGTSSVMQLDAWNWEDALYKEDDGVHMNWPNRSFGPRWWLGETKRRENKKYDEQVEELVKFIEDTKAYMESPTPAKNLKLEAMVPVLTGEKQLYLFANRPKQILEAIQTLKRLEIPKLVLTGAEDVWYVKDLLKAHNVPVLLENVHRVPNRPEEDIDLPYKLPRLLHEEGILVGLTYSSGMLANSRNLPFFAGTVAAHGLDKEEALKLITSNTAKILGIDDRTGTLEEGKDANIVVSDGDLLDMGSNQIAYSFIQGREVELEALQQRLYEKFKAKYED
ncbi:amidohydrolase family protein [Marinoscillum furvescens]|uniref:Imidazolonepropionase-like amidohydrolase n=1 Tax=Marinoscillum furvescens DSM 4134 TaxID=1122208 RepID=A0A3D9L185_MARFU|nr:amidohydrolase family protein [Marinoscillum furvescens]RED95635.1 imidazolonepropionase-like amidohydrolase [Marinoscillum furvescens DSM 4134]